MFLALFDQVDAAECALIRHLLRLHVFRRKEQLLGIEQQHARLRAGVDHRIGFLERHAQRLFAHDVLAGSGGIDRDLRVQAIGGGDRNHLDLRIAQQLAVVGECLGDAVAFGEIRRVALGG